MARAAPIIVAGVLLFYGWAWWPHEHQAQVWNITGSAVRLALLWILIWRPRGPLLWVALWWTAEELLVIGCGTAYMLKPWVVVAGEAQCRTLLGYDFGTVGTLVVAAIALIMFAGRQDR